MERIVRLVTKNLVRKLPSEKEFFHPDELRELSIPEFIIDRVRVEMERNLDDSIVPPYTEWADMSQPKVKDAWENFVHAIVEESRLPYAYSASVFETAVSDALDMMIQPRKVIPETIFGSDKALDREELEDRTKLVVVYKHLAIAPARYMDRKGLQALTIEQCREIIKRVDEKLVSNYNALNWAQLLEPLFTLLGEQLDTNLLRIFFEDKGMPKVARRFDMMNASVTRSGLIEVLSSPEILDYESYDEPQASLFEKKQAEKDSQGAEEEISENRQSEDSESFNETFKTEEQEIAPGKTLGEEEEESPDIEFTEDTEIEVQTDHLNEEDDEAEQPLHSRFVFDESATEEESEEKEYRFNEMFVELQDFEFTDSGEESENDEEKKKENDQTEMTSDEDSEEELKIEVEISGEEEDSDEEKPDSEDRRQYEDEGESLLSEMEIPDEEEGPIYQNFISEEEDDEFEDEEDEPIIDLTEDSEDAEKQAEAIIEWIGDDADRFIDEIFQESEIAFEEAMIELADIGDWKSATRYIEKEIFTRNFIDMYEEVAVDFTDRLHSFYTEFKSSKTDTDNGIK